jgi:hypothetical protein
VSTIPSTQNVLEESDTRVRRLGVRALSWLDAMKGMYRYMSLIPPAWQQAKSLFEAFSPCLQPPFLPVIYPKKLATERAFRFYATMHEGADLSRPISRVKAGPTSKSPI